MSSALDVCCFITAVCGPHSVGKQYGDYGETMGKLWELWTSRLK